VEGKESIHMSASTAYLRRTEPMIQAISMMSALMFINVSWARQEDSPKWSKEEETIINAVLKDRKATFPKDKKPVISASFLKKLSTGEIPGLQNPQLIRIENIQVKDDLDFSPHDIQPYFSLKWCVFHGEVDFSFCRFKHGLNLSWSEFRRAVSFQGMEVTGPFRCMGSHFYGVDKKSKTDYVDMSNLQVTGMLRLEGSRFEEGMSLFLARVSGVVNCDRARFDKWSRIVQANIGGALNIRDAHFDRGFSLYGSKIDGSLASSNVTMINGLECDNVRVGGDVSFEDAHFTYSEDEDYYKGNTFRSTVIGGNLDLNNAHFMEDCKLDFTGLKIGRSFDITNIHWPTSSHSISIRGMSYRDVVPTKLASFQALLEKSEFDPDAYNSVERFLRGYGHTDDANEIGMAQARRQREENMSFFPRVGSLFLYILVGNGYAPGRSLLWALAIILVGAFVFRKNHMVYVREKPTDGGKRTETIIPYFSLLYSFDLFVPAVSLGVANYWEPEPQRTGLFYWMYAQKILGWILVPIGVLAFSGIIKA
jgi:hypothetical protein